MAVLTSGEAYSLDKSAVEVLAEVVRWWRQNGRRLSQPVTPPPSAPAQAWTASAVVRVTSATPVSGFYPGLLQSYDGATDTFSDGPACHVRDVNGGALAVQKYSARRSGEYSGTLVYLTDLSGAGASLTVEDADSSPTYTGITTLRFDQADGFTLSNPSAGVARVDFSGGGSLTVEDADSVPTYSAITTLRFDQADGFILSNPSAGVARVDYTGLVVRYTTGTGSASGTILELHADDGFLITAPSAGIVRVDISPASNTQAGVVITTAQQWAGDKTFEDKVSVLSKFTATDHVRFTLNTQSPSAGTYNDMVVPGPGVFVASAPTGAVSITGWDLSDPSLNDGSHFWFWNEDTTNSVTFKHEDAGSTAANRIFTVSGADFVVGPGQAVLFVYYSTRWRIFADR